ncbi:serine hydrolase domain-containing protein [Gilvimarinus sp. F26214L]|uniref:serine hydrolase domain-containing protein n=1 Tax=Gilvimarinus sp. DZF01 TaxID=3461371 RepID=UPI00404685BE
MSRQTPDDLPMAEPEVVGMSAERLARIQPVMQRYVDDGMIPGAVTMVARHGKIVHFESCGYKEVARQDPMQVDTIFRVASMTKPIVSLALMMLYEEARFQLHDPLGKFIPAFAQMDVMTDDGKGGWRPVPAKRQINIRHILTHTAGFASEHLENFGGFSNKPYKEIVRPGDRSGTIGDFVERMAQAPLLFEPGEKWHYSRATCVVGRLVEVISGQSLKEFLEARIFAPLGMVDTHFFLPRDKASRFAASYKPGDDQRILLDDPNTEESVFLSETSEFYVGSGGLVSTAADYFRFAEMLRRGGRVNGGRLVSRKTVDLMTQNHVGKRQVWLSGAGYGFGLGFGVMLDQGIAHKIISPGSYSWGGMYCTYWWNDPVEQLFGMMLTQVRPYDHLNIRQDMEVLATQAIDD